MNTGGIFNMSWLVKVIQGALIGAGAVLPGVSGGVLAVLFGVYKPLMKLLAHPMKEWKNSLMQLWPILVGVVVGYIGIAKLLAEVLVRYETQALALFVGMTIGIMPSLFREAGEKGRDQKSWLSMVIVFAVALTVLIVCRVMQVSIVPNFFWNMYGGFSLVLSMIAPGMSASVLMLPLMATNAAGETFTLYEHITGAIGNLDFGVLLPIGVGAVLTLVLLTKAIDWLLNTHYSVTFHGIIGIVIAATIFTVPVAAFTAGVGSCLLHLLFVVLGAIATLALDKFNQKVEKPEVE
ncbi:MAG: DUF368 domain-containing protein [Clostridia bacterium]|nr:DUF368 domain-containing protein [Clostridia bacterium]